jgi:hypothetical protein
MHKSALLLALTALLTPAANAQSAIVSFYDGVKAKHGNMFTLQAIKPLRVDGFDVHFADAKNPVPCGTTCSVNEIEVYWRWGGYKGAEHNPGKWMLRGSVQHTISTQPGIPQPLNLNFDRTLVPGAKAGFYITATGSTNSVTGTPNEKTLSTYAYKSKLTQEYVFATGTDNVYPFGAATDFGGWNGTIFYTLCTETPVENYCQAGTSASGCQAVLETAGLPSGSFNGGFIVSAANVEGDKNGLVYFGTAGKSSQPWGNTTSFKCVNFPTNRGALIGSGGTPGTCTGNFSYDLNAHWYANPPHNPGAGVTVQAQIWYRDPQSAGNPKTAFSDAIEFTVCL